MTVKLVEYHFNWIVLHGEGTFRQATLPYIRSYEAARLSDFEGGCFASSQVQLDTDCSCLSQQRADVIIGVDIALGEWPDTMHVFSWPLHCVPSEYTF